MRVKTAQQAERVLDAAARLFGTQRFHEVRMDDIAAEAAVAKGTLYRYFADKDELHAALLDRAARQLRERIDARVAAADGAEAKLAAVVGEVLDFFTGQPHVFSLIQRAESLHGPHPAWQAVRHENVRHVVELFGRWSEETGARVADPETTALMLLGGLRAVVMMGPAERPADLPCRLVRACLYGAAYDPPRRDAR